MIRLKGFGVFAHCCISVSKHVKHTKKCYGAQEVTPTVSLREAAGTA
jgi:hypothetical protein